MQTRIILFAGLLLSLTACIRSAGPLMTEDRDVAPFTGLALTSSADVEVVQNEPYEVRVEAPDNLMPFIETEVDNGVLEIRERRNNIWHGDRVRIFVNMDELTQASISGSGDLLGRGFTAQNVILDISGSGDMDVRLDANNISASISGSGDMELEGTATNLQFTISGSGDFRGRYFTAENVDANMSSSGDAFVTVTDELTANLSGSGDLEYWGNPPVVNSIVTGSGDLIPR